MGPCGVTWFRHVNSFILLYSTAGRVCQGGGEVRPAERAGLAAPRQVARRSMQ